MTQVLYKNMTKEQQAAINAKYAEADAKRVEELNARGIKVDKLNTVYGTLNGMGVHERQTKTGKSYTDVVYRLIVDGENGKPNAVFLHAHAWTEGQKKYFTAPKLHRGLTLKTYTNNGYTSVDSWLQKGTKVD